MSGAIVLRFVKLAEVGWQQTSLRQAVKHRREAWLLLPPTE